MPDPSGSRGNRTARDPRDRILYLRVDVDTYLGTREGVPGILEVLARRRARATFFVSLGPDRSGRAVLRILRRRGFLTKMLRTRAVRAYGLSTCLRGTLLPSIGIGRRLPGILRRIRDEGHEAAAHAWDHVRWQDRLDRLGPDRIRGEVEGAAGAFRDIFDRPPQAWAAPGWVTTPEALAVLDAFGFRWMSNTRGREPYVPVVAEEPLRTVEIPVTLPTLDEVLGREGIEAGGYNDLLLALADAARPAVYTVHAETEGRGHREGFDRLLARLGARGWRIEPLGRLAEAAIARRADLPRSPIVYGEIPGRAGRVSLQGADRRAAGPTGPSRASEEAGEPGPPGASRPPGASGARGPARAGGGA